MSQINLVTERSEQEIPEKSSPKAASLTALPAVSALIRDFSPALITHRRTLHAMAETGFNEWQTLNYLVAKLSPLKNATLSFTDRKECGRIEKRGGFKFSDLGVPLPTVKHIVLGHEMVIPGLCVSFKPRQEAADHSDTQGPVVALRVDMDALPIEESRDPDHKPAALSFNAVNGCMHACGHDGHMAVALTLAELLDAHSELLTASGLGELRLIFQGAEEGCRGGRIFANSSFLDNVDCLYAFHLGMGVPPHCVAPTVTHFLPTLKFNLSFTGRKAHAGHPLEGVNALHALCSFITEAMGYLKPEAGRLINFANLVSRGARNVIPDRASVEGELRALTLAQLHGFEAELNALLDNTRNHFEGSTYHFTPAGFATEINSDPELTDKIRTAAMESGLEILPAFKFSASEDASLLIDRVQRHGGKGAYFVVGAKLSAPHHHSAFDFDESALSDALKVCLQLLLKTRVRG